MLTRLASSFDSHLDTFDEDKTDVASLPANYNDTKTEIVTIDGRQFIKKKTVIKKGSPGMQIYVTSVSYQPVDDTENVEPGSQVDNAGNAGGSAGDSQPQPTRTTEKEE